MAPTVPEAQWSLRPRRGAAPKHRKQSYGDRRTKAAGMPSVRPAAALSDSRRPDILLDRRAAVSPQTSLGTQPSLRSGDNRPDPSQSAHPSRCFAGAAPNAAPSARPKVSGCGPVLGRKELHQELASATRQDLGTGHSWFDQGSAGLTRGSAGLTRARLV